MKLLQKVGLDYSLLSGVDWIYCAVKNVSYIELFEENLFTYKCSLSWITLVRFVFELLKRNMVKFWWIVVFTFSFIRCNFHSYLCCVVVWFVCLVRRKAAVGVYLHVVIPVMHVVITSVHVIIYNCFASCRYICICIGIWCHTCCSCSSWGSWCSSCTQAQACIQALVSCPSPAPSLSPGAKDKLKFWKKWKCSNSKSQHLNSFQC